jgi:hypothetical protein
MKKLFLAIGIITTINAFGTPSHRVNGHTKKNGTYVQPSHATNPNGRKSDNYSNKGNVNPYTGNQGTK